MTTTRLRWFAVVAPWPLVMLAQRNGYWAIASGLMGAYAVSVAVTYWRDLGAPRPVVCALSGVFAVLLSLSVPLRWLSRLY